MRFTFQFFKGVELDIAKAKLWYKEQKPGLEEIFNREIRKTINLKPLPIHPIRRPVGKIKTRAPSAPVVPEILLAAAGFQLQRFLKRHRLGREHQGFRAF